MSDSSLVISNREALRAVLADHFVMWHELDGAGPPGEWRCACGKKFGFSDSAIDHQADALAGVVVTPDVYLAQLAEDEAAVETVARSLAMMEPDEEWPSRAM